MDKQLPVISVLISVRNGGDRFNLTLRSIAAQTLDRSSFEVLICDNGSTDQTPEFIKDWEKRGVCKLVAQNMPSKTLTEALLELTQKSRGKYLTRVDVGDVCRPERLAIQLAYLERNPSVGMICTTSLLMYPNGKIIGPLFSPLLKEVKLRHLVQKNFIVHGSIMMRKESYLSAGGYDVSHDLAEDFDLWTRMANQGTKIHWLKDPLYLYELDQQSTSSTRQNEQALVNQRIRGRYQKAGTAGPIQMTNLATLKRNATLRSLPGVGRVVQLIEGLIFEIKSGKTMLHSSEFNESGNSTPQ